MGRQLSNAIKYNHVQFNAAIPKLEEIPGERIRNFGIIAHIDHGKSTLADRLLELTGCLHGKNDANPALDNLPVEKERGITVKAQAASMFYQVNNDHYYLLNLIDTPGHVDFTNEVARSLTAMQGALLVVDAVTGVQAQTTAHYWRAKEYGVRAIIPVLNKIDLPQANIELVTTQLNQQFEFDSPPILVSAKTGLNIEKVLSTIITHIPSAPGLRMAPLQAVVVDCWYKDFQGVVCLINMNNGTLIPGDEIRSATSDRLWVIEEIGILQPEMIRTNYLHAGQVGWIRCGMKNTSDILIGDIFITPKGVKPVVILPKRPKPVVFASLFPTIREDYEEVARAIHRLFLNDSSVVFEKIVSTTLGPGWRLGFLGSLHMDVFKQRLEQEFNVDVILTLPNVSYEVVYKDDHIPYTINSAEDYPSEQSINNVREFRESYVRATIIIPIHSVGPVSKLCSDSRCKNIDIDYISEHRVKMTVILPLMEIIGEFNDHLLSISEGYSSFDYELVDSQPVDLVKVGIMLNGDLIDILSTVQPKTRADGVARLLVEKLVNLLPRQQFAVAIQAVIGRKVIARETLSAMRKDVIAKCYGGDKTRKMKLLEKQKEGKAKLKSLGQIKIPHESFASIMQLTYNRKHG